MIKQVLMNGVSVTNDYTFLSRVRDGASAGSDVQQYSRGGRSGITLGNPFYRGFVFQLEFTVIGRTPTQLLEQRDRLARFFRLRPDKTIKQTREISFVMADDSVRTAQAIFSPYIGSINARDTTRTVIQITGQTELEYLVSQQEFNQVINIVNLGGFAIPFDIPFNMANKDDMYQDEGGGVTINNLGNAEYYPTITVQGPLNIFSLINDTTGKTISYNGELLAEDTLILDMYNRTAVKNGITNDLLNIGNNPDWWWLDAGNNAIRLVAGGGTGSATINYRYAYRGL